MKGYIRGPDLKKRMHRGMKSIIQRPRPTGLYCPNCLLELEFNKGDQLYAYFCENCMKTYIRSRVLTFDGVVSVKFMRAKH